MRPIGGFILSGGQSRRMGRDKCELTLGDRTFVELISEQMVGVTSSIKVVGGLVADSQLSHVADIHPHWGALGGVHAALANCSSDWALVVACDFPLVTTELFTQMADVTAGFDAVAPVQHDGVPQPLCTLYRVEPCLAQAEQLIKSGERKPIALLQSVRTRWIAFDELRHLEGSGSFFDNINTPEDYARITKQIEPTEAAT
ncbi:MAG TPA: molybdenum cofactor guanylyltransferase [Pyrinomonadaceae bacterium]|nr:molybdenum cofactor guanylyltransferase [Pyrinomonadaceae bacterium]